MSLTIVSLTFRAYCLHTSRLHCTLQSLAHTRYLANIWHTQIIHMFTAVLFSQILVMLCFKFVYAISCGILRYLLLIVSS